MRLVFYFYLTSILMLGNTVYSLTSDQEKILDSRSQIYNRMLMLIHPEQNVGCKAERNQLGVRNNCTFRPIDPPPQPKRLCYNYDRRSLRLSQPMYRCDV